MPYAICTVAAAPVRKEPSHRTEMTNQVLFGQVLEILQRDEEWIKIRTLSDGYEGWLTHHLFRDIDRELAMRKCSFIATGLINPVLIDGRIFHVPMGSVLTGFDENTGLLWDKGFHYQGSFRDLRQPAPPDLLDQTMQAWMHAPYLWGGKTLMGVDCSGFVQTVFALLGVALQRDAWQQADQGTPVPSLTNVKKGDLAFFKNESGRITHVGIISAPGEIVHASGKVRADRLEEEGIWNADVGKITHRLHSLRRMI